MDDTLLALLRSVDTPTVCNAIEVAQGKRGFNGFTRGTMLCSDPEGGAMVGYAVTAKISALDPPTEPADVIRARRRDPGCLPMFFSHFHIYLYIFSYIIWKKTESHIYPKHFQYNIIYAK